MAEETAAVGKADSFGGLIQPFLGTADRIRDVQTAPRERLTTREVVDDRFVPRKIRFDSEYIDKVPRRALTGP